MSPIFEAPVILCQFSFLEFSYPAIVCRIFMSRIFHLGILCCTFFSRNFMFHVFSVLYITNAWYAKVSTYNYESPEDLLFVFQNL